MLDSNNNLLYADTFLECEGKELILQDVKTCVSMLKREYPFNEEEGFDFFSYMQNNSSKVLLQEIKNIS